MVSTEFLLCTVFNLLTWESRCSLGLYTIYDNTIENFIFLQLDVFSSLKPPEDMGALNETSIGMECSCQPTCSEHVKPICTYRIDFACARRE